MAALRLTLALPVTLARALALAKASDPFLCFGGDRGRGTKCFALARRSPGVDSTFRVARHPCSAAP